MRIFHGHQNIGGMAGLLADAQRSLGYRAESVCLPTGPFQFEVDRLFPNGNPLAIAQLLWQFDVFHFYFGESLTGPNLIDVPWLKRLGKKIFFHFCGCDIRDSKTTIAQYATSACAECWPQLCSENRLAARNVALRHADGIFVSTPDLLEFVPGAQLLLQPIDVPKLESLARAARASASAAPPRASQPFRVAHAPSNRQIKGTRYVMEAIERLQARGLNVELVLIEKMAHADAMALCATCDLAVDQLLVGAYGQFAMETMMLGLPTLCYLREDVVRHYPADCPVLCATRENLADQIADWALRLPRSIADSRLADTQWADVGQNYVRKHHDALVAAQTCIDAYTRAVAASQTPATVNHSQRDEPRLSMEGILHEARV